MDGVLLEDIARCDADLLTSLFGANDEVEATRGRTGVAEVWESVTDGVVGLIEEAGLPLSDDIVDILLSHDRVLILSGSSTLPDASFSWPAAECSDLLGPRELWREMGGVDIWA
jgi:hypothetical protein